MVFSDSKTRTAKKEIAFRIKIMRGRSLTKKRIYLHVNITQEL